MLRVVAHKSAAAARQYYAEGLRREDYYSEGQEIAGKWHGLAAQRLGLKGSVTPEAFAALVENRHPETGQRLTPRTKADRVVGYDINFHAPKSLSLVYALTQDPAILTAFRRAAAETLSEMEWQVSTRVRRGGSDRDRVTGNMVWAEFVHFTARPVGGIPDPHLHVHNFVMNSTFDPVEGRWKAGNFRELKAWAPHHEAVFHARLADALAAQGYGIERTLHGWEIRGMPESVIAKFSRRTEEIERLAAEKGITDAKAKDALGAASREGKRHGLTWSDLLAQWGQRLTPEEKAALSRVCYEKEPQRRTLTAGDALDFAQLHHFERESVVAVDRLIATALRHGVGQVTPEQVRAEFMARELVVREVKGELLCTSLPVLAEEVALIQFVRGGRGTAARLGARSTYEISDRLSDEQRAAVNHILGSRDRVIALRGAAGVGKTTLMREAVNAIESAGKKVFAFAPSAAASRETLRAEGFGQAETVALLLRDKRLQQRVRGQVIWIDEAGLLGMRDLWQVMQAAGPGTRIILTGDAAQHSPVARGDAFRLLQKYAGLKLAEVTQIRRQEGEGYRLAIEALSRADLRTAFRRLEEIGAFIEIEDESARHARLAADYVEGLERGNPPLVVSPTHAEGAKVTEAIRGAKREAGFLGPERLFSRLENLQWTEAERTVPLHFQPGMVIQYHQNAKGVTRGQAFEVVRRDGETVLVKDASGAQRPLPLKDANRFQVFARRSIGLGKGDLLRITSNGKTADGRRVSNGSVFKVAGFDRQGRIRLHTGGVLEPGHGHFTHGYCQTSHSAQSKTVKDVLVAQSADSFLAAGREQFYVSCSRGKQSIRIYTDDRRGLFEAVGASSTRTSGMELAGITKSDLSGMNSPLSAKQWTERISSKRGQEDTRSWTEKLAAERNADPLRKTGQTDWRGYIEARRANVSASGKHRSKGYPQAPDAAQKRTRGIAWPKLTEHTKPVRDQMKKAGEAARAEKEPSQPNAQPAKPGTPAKPSPPGPKPERQPSGRVQQAARAVQGRMKSAYESAAGHFKTVMNRSDNARTVKAKPAQPSTAAKNRLQASDAVAAKTQADRIVQRTARQKRTEAGQPAKAPVQQKQQVPQQAQKKLPPPPPPKPPPPPRR